MKGRPRKKLKTVLEKNSWYLVRKFEGGLAEFENLCGNRIRIQFHNCERCNQPYPEGKGILVKKQLICSECHAINGINKNPISDAEAYKEKLRKEIDPADAGERRRLRILRATPKWSDKKAIQTIYRRANRLTRISGIPHHVDHCYPIANALACGLHVAENLQILPYDVNIRKSNKFPLDNSPAWAGMSDEEIQEAAREMVVAFKLAARNSNLAKALSGPVVDNGRN